MLLIVLKKQVLILDRHGGRGVWKYFKGQQIQRETSNVSGIMLGRVYKIVKLIAMLNDFMTPLDYFILLV